MSHDVTLTDHAMEGGTKWVDLQFVDESGVGFEPDTIEAKLFDLITLTVINNRTGVGEAGQDVKNTNGGTVDGSGNFSLRLDPEDNAIVSADPDKRLERHGLWIKWTWGGSNESWAIIVFVVARKVVP